MQKFSTKWNQIQQHIERIKHHVQVRHIQWLKGWFSIYRSIHVIPHINGIKSKIHSDYTVLCTEAFIKRADLVLSVLSTHKGQWNFCGWWISVKWLWYKPANAGDIRNLDSIPGLGRSPGGGTATYSSILAWRILWTEDPGGL